MAAKGTEAKKNITEKILEVFPGSFTYEKEIRIPYTENGAEGQIKITLTAAKNIIETGAFTPTPTAEKAIIPPVATPSEPSEEEKERLKTLLDILGL